MEINIHKDLRDYKSKDIGNFNWRECVFIALALLFGIFGYTQFGSIDYAVPLMIPPLVFGFLKPKGMSFWTYIRTVMREKMLPKEYPYESDFVYDYESLKKMFDDHEINEEAFNKPCSDASSFNNPSSKGGNKRPKRSKAETQRLLKF